MTIDDLLAQARRWLARQHQLRSEAERLGDAAGIAAADSEIEATVATIAALETL